MTTSKDCKIYETMEHDYDTVYKMLVYEGIATEEEIDLVGRLVGFSVNTLTDILFTRTGYTNPGDFDHFEADDYYYNYLAAKMEG